MRFYPHFKRMLYLHFNLFHLRVLSSPQAEVLSSLKRVLYLLFNLFIPPTKSEGYGFGVFCASVRPSIPPVRLSVHTFCLSGTISQYLLVRFDSFLVQMLSTMDSGYPISFVKIDPLTLELLPLFWYRQL